MTAGFKLLTSPFVLSGLLLAPVAVAAAEKVPQERPAEQKAAVASPAESAPVGSELPRLRTPKVWNDPAFNQYVNLDLLDKAIARQKPALLTDVALQFVEGERILHRSHKAIAAAKLLQMAVLLASSEQDQKSLARLAKAAKDTDNSELSAIVTAAMKVTDSARSEEPAVLVDANQTSPDAISEFQAIVSATDVARLIGDRDALEELQSKLDKIEGLNAEQLKSLESKLRSALETVEEKSPAASALSQLEGVSRRITVTNARAQGLFLGKWFERNDGYLVYLYLNSNGYQLYEIGSAGWDAPVHQESGTWTFKGGSTGTLTLSANGVHDYFSYSLESGSLSLEAIGEVAIDDYYEFTKLAN